ncbi:MAG: DUF262 domain-containing protein [Candidatus Nanopelagicaceae bacterium]|nr:DUF262 domain-containing protein [Candidatus Nanopelagicaceae bacterium]
MAEYFDRIWNIGTMPLKTVAAFTTNSQACPSELLGQTGDYVRFEIPSFQRGLVWSKKKRIEFLRSLFNGWPTGAIVLTKIGQKNIDNSTGREITWHVIDGQQRLATYNHFRTAFWSEPWYTFTPEMDLAAVVLSETLEHIKSEDVIAAVHLLTKGDSRTPFKMEYLEESRKFLARLCQLLDIECPVLDEESPRYQKIEEACRVLRTAIKVQRDCLDEIPIAIITISPQQGSPANEVRGISADIFSALNSGIPLSKYDLLAAQWVSTSVPWEQFQHSPGPRSVTDALTTTMKNYMLNEMRSRITRSYGNYSEDLELDSSVEELAEDQVSLFDFLYALSISARQYASRETSGSYGTNFTLGERLSFPSGASSSNVAFDTAALLFAGGYGTKSIDNLRFLFPYHSGEFDIGIYAEHFLDAAKHIDSKLAVYTKNSTKNKKKAVLGAVQASVYLASYVNNIYDLKRGEEDNLTIGRRSGARERTIDGITNLSQSQRVSLVRANLPSWWLLDTLTDHFQGSDAYVNAKQRVWVNFDLAEASDTVNIRPRVRSVKENDYLLAQPTLYAFTEVFKTIFINEFQIGQAPVNRSPSQSALTLFHVVFKEKAAEMEKYDMDHIVAYRATRSSGLSRLTRPIPLNHIANWMPLLPSLNRSRQNLPWAEFYSGLSATDKIVVSDDLLIDPSLLTRSVLDTEDAFAIPLLIRWAGMINQALLNIGLAEYQNLSVAQRKDLLKTQVIEPIITSLLLSVSSHDVMAQAKIV